MKQVFFRLRQGHLCCLVLKVEDTSWLSVQPSGAGTCLEIRRSQVQDMF